jgi:aminopeptidase N
VTQLPWTKPASRVVAGVTALLLGATAPVIGTATAAEVAPAAGAPAASAAPRPGGESAGDSLFPTIGNTGYRVSHYAITLDYRSSGGRITATTDVTARAAHPLSRFSFDFEGLTVDQVRVNGVAARFRRHDHKLVVTPARPVSGTFRTAVRYHGKPVTHIDADGSKDGWVATSDGATVVSEPVGAMTWFPNNNTPRDKATFAMRVTAPSSLAVAANGDLRSRRSSAGRTTWTWVQTRQMATYLASISIGRYHVYHSTMRTTAGRRLPVWSFVEPKYGTLARLRGRIPEIVRFQERRFGSYPQTSVGIVVDDLDVGYALETQNRPVFDGVPSTLTLVHELAHQWYGDSVTPRVWEDIWLNEGFASFAESLWTAAHGGPSTRAAFDKTYADNPPSSKLWRPAPADFTDPRDLFGDPVYTRGGMTLEALRREIGTTELSTVLRLWATMKAGRSVSTPEFVALAERVSHRDLSPLFRTWLYVPEKPAGY